MPDQRFLISDIGGTNIRMAWFAGNPRNRQDEANFRIDAKTHKPYEVLTALKEYSSRVNQSFSAACLGAAGEVQGDCVKMTNRPDTICREDIATVLKIDESKVLLINDMPPHMACVDLLFQAQIFGRHDVNIICESSFAEHAAGMVNRHVANHQIIS